MGLFDFFKKKEPGYDVTNMSVHDLDVGFVFDYELTAWEVKAVFEYDWGDNYFTKEFQVTDGSQIRYLGVEEDDELELSWMQKIKIQNIDKDLLDELIDRQKPPRKVVFNGIIYRMTDVSTGYFNSKSKGDTWEEVRTWDFEDESGENLLCIEQWDDEDFEGSYGKSVKEFEISNILPGERRG